MLKNILVGLDGSQYSDAALELGISWAIQYNATLVGLAIVDEPTILEPEAVPIGGLHYEQMREDAQLADARKKADEFLAFFRGRCSAAQIRFRTLEDIGLPYEQILLEAQRFDLVLLGRQTTFHFETEVVDHDTLKRVLKSTPRPVIVVPETHPQGPEIAVAYDGSLQAARALHAFQASGLYRGGTLHLIGVAETPVEAEPKLKRAAQYLESHGMQTRLHAIAPQKDVASAILATVHMLGAGMLVTGAYGNSTLREFMLGSVTRSLLEQSPVPIFLFH